MKYAVLLLLLLASSGFAEEARIVKFRLKKDPLALAKGYMSEWNQEGFKFRGLGLNRGVRMLRWSDLVPEDARDLRVELKLELSEDEKLGLMEGHRIHFRGGGYEDGLYLGTDRDGHHLLKVKGMVFPYPKDRVEHVEEVKVREDEVYSKEEVYVRALERRKPRTAREHRDVADYLYEQGNFTRARDHYQQALEMDASLQEGLRGRLAELEEYARYDEVRKVVQEARYRSNLRRDFDGALAVLQEFAESHPKHARIAAREMTRVQERKQYRLQLEFIYRKHREYDREIERFLYRRPDLGEARSWVRSQLPKILKERIMKDMDLTEEEFQAFLANRGKGALHWAGYWAGSFIISKRAAVGRRTKNRIAGDPEGWWRRYSQIGVQKNWLKAYAAERLPDFFDVVSVNHEPCERCGGRGVRTVGSLSPADGGRHEWKETCPRCFGAGKDRSVGYR